MIRWWNFPVVVVCAFGSGVSVAQEERPEPGSPWTEVPGSRPAAPAAPGSTAGENGLQKLGRLRRLNERLVRCVPWHESAEHALAAAIKSRKLVFAWVLVDPGTTPSAHERALAFTSLLDADVRAFLQARFEPVRIATKARFHMNTTPVKRDPLLALGSSCAAVKAPALVVCTGDGTLVASLGSIGSWSKRLVSGFLLRALEGAPQPHGSPSSFEDAMATGDLRQAQALALKLPPIQRARGQLAMASLLGEAAKARAAVEALVAGEAATSEDRMRAVAVLLAAHQLEGVDDLLAPIQSQDGGARLAWLRGEQMWHRGEESQAHGQWHHGATLAPPSSILRLRIDLRTANPHGLDELAPRLSLNFDAKLTTTERPRRDSERTQTLRDAVAYLLLRQRKDGRFVHGSNPAYDAAVTALAGKAMERVRGQLPQTMVDPVGRAVETAQEWCVQFVQSADHVTCDSFGAAYLLDFLVVRSADHEDARDAVPAAVGLLLGGQLENGGWSYNRKFGSEWQGGFGGWPKTTLGRAHSINTGMALWALAKAQAAGFDIPVEALQAGVAALESMRAAPATLTYTWPEPRNFEGANQSIGKAPVCLQALVALGKAKPAELEQALADFMKWRGGLRATVKLTPSWIGPSGTSSYFFLHATYHAAEAIQAAGGPRRTQRLHALGKDLLACAEWDGTWLDYEVSGKTYGTAMALLVLARMPVRSR